jgi:trimeric autotransporter adhesin
MKSKLTVQITGIVITIVTLVSLLAGITAAPVSAATPGALSWTVLNTPGLAGKVLISSLIAPKTQPSHIAISPDGNTIFVYDNVNKNMYVSTDAGLSFGSAVTITGASGNAVAMAVSPQYATDKTTVLVEADSTGNTPANNHVWRTTDGGATWSDVSPSALQAHIGAGNTISSVDLAYTPSTLNIIIGVSGGVLSTIVAPDTAASNVLRFQTGSSNWTAFGKLNYNVYGVKFSPNTASDTEVMAVYVNGANTLITSSFSGNNFDTTGGASPCTIVVAASSGLTQAIIATASDYIGNTGANILVGTNGLGAADGVYYINGRKSNSAGSHTASVVTGAGNPIASLVIAGASATAAAYYGLSAQNTATVFRSTAFTSSTPGWTNANKLPTGTTSVTTRIVVSGTNIYALTIGAKDSALSRSVNHGTDFNQISLIDVDGNSSSTSLVNLETVDNNTMFLLMKDTAAPAATQGSLFKTVNGGTNWERILTGTSTMTLLSASPAYATDTTLCVADTSTSSVMKTTNGGASFTSVSTNVNPTCIKMITGGVFFYGGANGAFYKAGSAASATGLDGTVFSIATKDTAGTTIAVGNNAGTVYESTNGGTSFAKLGGSPSTNNLIVAYGPDGTRYAADSTNGLFRYNGTSSWPAAIQTGRATGLEIATDGTLYMSDGTTSATNAVWRALFPATTVPAFQSMGFAGSNYAIGEGLTDLAVVSGTDANTVYGLDSAATTTLLTGITGFGYSGGIIAFKDTLIGPVSLTSPPNSGTVANNTTTTLSWRAISGAATYGWTCTGTSETSTSGTSATPNVSAGSTNTWSVRVLTPLYSRPSDSWTFTSSANAVSSTTVTTTNTTSGATLTTGTPTESTATTISTSRTETTKKGIPASVLLTAIAVSAVLVVIIILLIVRTRRVP